MTDHQPKLEFYRVSSFKARKPLNQMQIKSYLDQVATQDHTMSTSDCEIDPDKVTQYLETIAIPEYRPVIQDIIDRTQHVTFAKFYSEMLKSLAILKGIKYNIFFRMTGKMGSEHWLTILFWNLIKDNCVQIISSYQDITNDLPLVYIDDCIYSGERIFTILEKFNMEYYITQQKFISNEFIMLVPYVSYLGQKHIKRLTQEFKINLTYAPHNVIINHLYVEAAHYFFDILRETHCLSTFRAAISWEDTCCTLYFDWKIASFLSSFPKIYKKIVKNKPSRSKIEAVVQLFTTRDIFF